MGDEIIKIIGYITERLESMGPQAEQAFRLLVNYQRVDGIIGVLFSLTVITICLWYFRVRLKHLRKTRGDYMDGVWFFGDIAFGIVAAIAFLYLFRSAERAMIPEYYAIKELLGAVKPR